MPDAAGLLANRKARRPKADRIKKPPDPNAGAPVLDSTSDIEPIKAPGIEEKDRKRLLHKRVWSSSRSTLTKSRNSLLRLCSDGGSVASARTADASVAGHACSEPRCFGHGSLRPLDEERSRAIASAMTLSTHAAAATRLGASNRVQAGRFSPGHGVAQAVKPLLLPERKAGGTKACPDVRLEAWYGDHELVGVAAAASASKTTQAVGLRGTARGTILLSAK